MPLINSASLFLTSGQNCSIFHEIVMTNILLWGCSGGSGPPILSPIPRPLHPPILPLFLTRMHRHRLHDPLPLPSFSHLSYSLSMGRPGY